MGAGAGVDVANLALTVDDSGKVKVDGFAKSLDTLAEKATSSTDTLKKAFLGVSGVLAANWLGEHFLKETIAAQNEMAQLEAVVTSTGGAAGRSVQELDELSKSIQAMSTFSDEAAKSAESVLLSFTKIRGDNFDRAALAATNLAQRMGDGDGIAGKALQLGKALNDPTQALAQLARTGIQFSIAQRDMIDGLVQNNELAKAQTAILDALEQRFGGAAVAARNTLGGALKGLANDFGDLFEVSRSGSDGAVEAINHLDAAVKALGHNLGALATAGELLVSIFASRAIIGASASLVDYAAKALAARAATISLAADQVKLAEANLLAEETLVAEKLAQSELIITSQLTRASMARLAEADRILAASEINLIELRKAATIAQVEYNTVTSIGTVVMTTASGAAKNLWKALGGWPTALAVALFGIYEMIKKVNDLSLEKTRKAFEDATKGAEEYSKKLRDMSTDALKAAEAQEQLNMSMLAGKLIAQSKAVVAARQSTASGQMTGGEDLTGGSIGNVKALNDAITDYDTTLGLAAASSARLAAISVKLGVSLDHDKEVAKEYTKALDDATGALNRQNAINAANAARVTKTDAGGRAIADPWGDLDIQKKLADINAQFDLQAKLAEIAVKYVGAQAKTLSDLAVSTDRAAKSARQYADEQARAKQATQDFTDSIKQGEEIQAKASAGYQEGFVKLGQYQDMLVAVVQKRREERKAAQEQIDTQQDQIAVMSATGERARKLADAFELIDLTLNKGFSDQQATQFIAQKHQLEDLADKTQHWGDKLQAVVGIVQLLAAAMDAAGSSSAKAILAAAAATQSIISGVKAAGSIKSAAGTPVGFSSALSGGGGLGAAASAIGVIGAVAGGLLALGNALGSLDHSQEKAQKHADELTKAFDKTFAAEVKLASQTGATADTMETIIAATTALQTQLRAATDAQLKAARGDEGKVKAAFDSYIDGLQRIADLEEERKKKLQEQADALKAFNEGNKVLALRVAGLDAEADAMQTQLDIQAKVDAAVKQFGNSIDAVAYKALLTAKAEQDLAKAHAAAAEEARRNIFSSTNGTRAFTDPVGASRAQELEDANNRVFDAIARGASEAEIAAIKLYNAAKSAADEAQRAEDRRRSFESLLARALNATGSDRAGSDAAFQAGQRQELYDAIKAGMDPLQLAFLKFTEFAEGSQREMLQAVEDGTNAIRENEKNQIAAVDVLIDTTKTFYEAELAKIDEEINLAKTTAEAIAKGFDEQIASVRDAAKAQTDAIDAQIQTAQQSLKVAQSQLSSMQEQVQTSQKIVDGIRNFRDSVKLGDLSTLSPGQKEAEAARQFEAIAKKALANDTTAAQALPAAAQTYLQAERAYSGSNTGFTTASHRVDDVLAAVEAQYGAQLPIDQQQLEALKAQVTGTQEMIDQLGRQKDAIQKAAEAQITILQKAKDKAAEDAKTEIDRLDKLKDVTTKAMQDTLTKLDEQKQAIHDAAEEQITALKAAELQAHQDRLANNEYWKTYLEIVKNGFPGPLKTPPKTINPNGLVGEPSTPAPPTFDEQKRTTQLIADANDRLDQVIARVSKGNELTVTGSEEEIDALQSLSRGIFALATETRNAANAAIARANSGSKSR